MAAKTAAILISVLLSQNPPEFEQLPAEVISINGESITVPRGKPVKVPVNVAKVLVRANKITAEAINDQLVENKLKPMPVPPELEKALKPLSKPLEELMGQ